MESLLGQFARLMGVLAALAFLAVSPVLAAPYAAIVIDARTGETLYAKNADTRLHPASLTKMMTLYITFEEIRRGKISLDTMVTVSKHAASEPPSRLGLRAGQKIALRYLIRAAAVKSANDAAAAIGDAIGGSPAGFAKRMNRTAKSLGMSNSTFRNANGLTASGHLSTARDMNTLGRRLFYDFPEFYNIFSRRSTDAGMAQVANTNRKFLDSYAGADGIKTGYTVPAGFNLTASAERGNVRIIATIFGGQSTAQRNSKMAELLDLGFAKAPINARVTKPVAPVYQDTDELIAAIAPEADEDEAFENAPGGSAKTIRLIMAVNKSPRPKGRPDATAPIQDVAVAEAAVNDSVAIAMQQSIAGALAEATTPPPEGTLEAQTLAIVDVLGAPAIADKPLADGAIVDTATIPLPAGTLDAQSAALSSGNLSPETSGTDAPTDLASTDLPASAAALLLDPMATIVIPQAAQNAPRARPSQKTPAPDVALASVVPAEETLPLAIQDTAATTAPPSVESLAVAAPVQLAANVIRPAKRNAPIFDKTVENAGNAEAEQEIVTRISTSGGKYWGVNVGRFNSSYEAERALLKTQLTESATLNDGLRKVTKKGGSFDANFMGLSQEQADLACRRLQARAVQCFTIGP